ncbi:MAG: Crp/Fnr family transcriptional regulator [Magnetospirillum sp.]|nr:Crp/Fnr family transcriptional regulator [Magnetospirillum sp.]
MSDLLRIAAFAGLSENGQYQVKRGASIHHFGGGKTIIEKGQGVSGAYFVLEGRLRVFSLLPSGREATLYPIAPGETCVLALNSLFNDLLYPAWVETELPTTVAVIPGRLYRELFETERAVQDLTVHTLSTLVFRLMAELDQVHACTLEQRLAGFLLVRASARAKVRHTQQEIASQLGTTREVIARLTSRMAAQGLIATGRGEITLLNPPALSALVHSDMD